MNMRSNFYIDIEYVFFYDRCRLIIFDRREKKDEKREGVQAGSGGGRVLFD